jgi:hypothetical protein
VYDGAPTRAFERPILRHGHADTIARDPRIEAAMSFPTRTLTGALLACAVLAGAYFVAASTANAVAATIVPATIRQVRVAAFACQPDIAGPGTRPPKRASFCRALRDPRLTGASSDASRRDRYPPSVEQETRSHP